MGEGDNGESRYWGKEIIGEGIMGEEDRKGRGYTEKGKRREKKGRKYREERWMRGEMRRRGYLGKGWYKENKVDILERTR